MQYNQCAGAEAVHADFGWAWGQSSNIRRFVASLHNARGEKTLPAILCVQLFASGHHKRRPHPQIVQ